MKIPLILLVFFSTFLFASAKEKVSLQLMWVDQFQFAGYYMAKEKGFYEEAGLEVEIKKFAKETNTVEEVMSSRATYGVGRSSLIRTRSEGEKVVLLSAIFQSSPFVLITKDITKIKSIKDFRGKKIMLTKDASDAASIRAMIMSSGVKESELEILSHSFNFDDLLDGKVDLYAGYTTNETFILQEKNIPYRVFSPKDEGFDFYSDILFTSQKELEKHPQRVERFRDASLRGWRYAFENIEESIELIHEKYNPANKSLEALRYEAKELKKLAFEDNTKFGEIKEERVHRILDIYKILGFAKDKIDMDEFIFSKSSNVLSAKEYAYLRDKKEIRLCMIPSFLPYSTIKDGEIEGIGAGILDIISQSVPINFRLIKTNSWQETLSLAREGKCDFLPIAEDTKSRREYLDFTTSYFKDSIAIVTNDKKNYILDIRSVSDKEFSVTEGYSFVETIREKYPELKLHIVSTRKEGFMGVQKGKYYGHIDAMMAAAYYMQNNSKLNLKISGQLEDDIKISFGVKKDDEILLSIFQKIANELEPKDIQRVLNEWVSINYTTSSDYGYLKNVLLIVFGLTLIFGYRHYILKKKNKQLQILQNQLVRLNKSLETKVADAVNDVLKKDAYLLHQSRLAQMGEMLSMIAHQWKQPLSSISSMQIAIRMAIELERFDLSDEKQREEFLEFVHQKLDKIAANTQNLSQTISNFSDFYKPNKKAEIRKLDKVVMKACSLIEDNMDASNISISMSLHSDSVVKLHENEFMQVILNLLNNAKDQLIEKAIKDAQIKIKSYDEKGDVILEISDNALGIDKSIIDNVFDPYFSTKLEKNGTGLGLYMSKQIIEEYHDGSISVKNGRDGAIFTIKLEIEDNDAK
ncbi:ABC transporter substrate-binding protein [Sulfurimonas hongkongensis]|nr:ABC transporter substrate-binding protein [Sulfurimonas hongkongensis]